MHFLFLIAMAAPTLIIFRVPPSHTLYNQALAIILWGLAVYRLPRHVDMRIGPRSFLMAMLLLLALTVFSALRNSPPHLIIAYAVFQFSAIIVFCGGVRASSNCSTRIPDAFFRALCITSVLNAGVCYLQVFVPQSIDHVLIAQPWSPDRATGNIRQPNLMALQCAWGLVGTIYLVEAQKIKSILLPVLVVFLCAAVSMTGSRTGFLLILCLAAWAAFDRELKPQTRAFLGATPFLVLAVHFSFHALSTAGVQHARTVDLESGRFEYWKQVLSMIREYPISGVGFANLNFAWTLTPFNRENPETFTHAHNLVLQWAVELGLPITIIIIAFFAHSIRSSFKFLKTSSGPDRLVRKCSILMVVLVLIHSLVEYPLWYASFLLPTAFAWGMMSKSVSKGTAWTSKATSSNLVSKGALCMALAAAASVYDYQKIVEIYRPWPSGPSDEQRIQNGRTAIAYGHLADRFAGTLAKDGHRSLAPFQTATREVLDMRLLIAWSLAMRETGHLDKARYLAQRVKDFNDPVSKQFFEKCTPPAAAKEQPWQCTPPVGHYTYRDFL